MIDGWKVTTTDTAIAFRKISRGSTWLEYNPWREFLEELVIKKGLSMEEVRSLVTSLLARWWPGWGRAGGRE